MKVAVPWPKHSWMFGQLASSQTVTRRFSRSFAFSAATAPLLGMRTRIHEGLRSTGASSNFTGLREILSPATCFAPGSNDAGVEATTCNGIALSGADLATGSVMASGGLRGVNGEVGRRRGLQRQAELRGELVQQHRLDRIQAGRAAQV